MMHVGYLQTTVTENVIETELSKCTVATGVFVPYRIVSLVSYPVKVPILCVSIGPTYNIAH